MLPLISGTAELAPMFAPAFLTAIPPAQLRQLFAGMRSQYGAPQRVVSLIASTPSRGRAIIALERADVTIDIAVDADGRIIELLIVDAATRGDTLALLAADVAALPGQVGWGLYRLPADGAAPLLIAGNRTGEAHAIGSAFKLAVLGALDAEIAAGRMRWEDVIRLDRRSVPSGITQDWPQGAPMTLHSAAVLMISISDNSATDLLVRHIGRERVEAFARAHGGLSGPNAFPLLTTIEATVLKNPLLGAARTEWLAGDEAQRRSVLTRHADLFVPANVNYDAFAVPADIGQIEWFASPDSLATLLSWYARQSSETARAILAVNPGLSQGGARRWAYAGYKGGSEPGVIAMQLLLRNAAGENFAISFAWNNSAAPVDDARLVSFVERAATLLNQPSAN